MSEEKDMTVEEFCDRHEACKEGREWALRDCKSMRDVWATAKPEWLIWVATRRGVLSDRECRLFAVHCAKSVEHLLADQRSRDAISVAERFANGEATQDELTAASAAAKDAAWSAAKGAAWSSAWSAARAAALKDAARAAAWSAARDAASAAALKDAARAAAWSAARDAAWSAAWNAASALQSAWLRVNTQPVFKA